MQRMLNGQGENKHGGRRINERGPVESEDRCGEKESHFTGYYYYY